MAQLTLQDIYDVARILLVDGENLRDYPVYLGNDDELNGIHCGWYANILDKRDNDEDNQYIIKMINEDHCNIKFKDKAILIS